MKINVSEIYEGWRNHLIPPDKLKDVIEYVANERMAICGECKYNSKNTESKRFDVHCTQCGCTLVAKTKCLSCSCPKEYWKNVVTNEQEEEIRNGK